MKAASNDSQNYFIGIDLAWTPGRHSGIAIINQQGQLKAYHYPNNVHAIIEIIQTYPNSIIGVDAPLIITNPQGHRPNERLFLKCFARYGLGVHAANTSLFAKRFPGYTGFTLYALLQKFGYDFNHNNLYEVYPHATILVNFNHNKVLRYKANTRKTHRIAAFEYLQNSLSEALTIDATFLSDPYTLKGKALKEYEDFLDALVCAYTLLWCRLNKCYRFGSTYEGILLTPIPEDSGSK